MQQISVKFSKIYEHDMDLLIIEEFISDKGFARIFLNKLNLSDDYIVEKAVHSLADEDGESDITIIIKYSDKRVALLIEDKIDAKTMPEQSDRYYKRAKKGQERGEYDESYIFLVAPYEYCEEHKTDGNARYENIVFYEELSEYLSNQDNIRAIYKSAIINHAIKEKNQGYVVEENPSVTDFWIKLRSFCEENYSNLTMLGSADVKGTSARWPEFCTSFGKCKVVYKSQKGCVDFELPSYGDRIGVLKSKIIDKVAENMSIEKTGKSASVRIKDGNWVVDFSKNFDEYRETISEVLDAVSALCNFASDLNYNDFY